MEGLRHRIGGWLRSSYLDCLLALALAVASVVALWEPPAFVDFDYRAADGVGVLLTLMTCGPVAFRRQAPVHAVLLSLTGFVPLIVLDYSQPVAGLSTLLTLYSVAALRQGRVSGPIALVGAASVGAVLLTSPLEPTLGEWLANFFMVVGAWMLGRSVRVRRIHLADVEARNVALAEARGAETRRMLSEERSRTAHEMQDLVAHSLTEVNVQVAAARRILDRDPAAADLALREAERASRGALEEIRRVADVLGQPAAVELRPQPGLDDLPGLVDRHRAEGVEVAYQGDGLGRVPAGVGLAAYRVVEEALGNATRHAPSRPVQVCVTRTGGELSVQVVNPTDPEHLPWEEPEPPADSTLHRLRARVAAYGGDLRWGRCRDGSFGVLARFPCDAVRSE